MNKRQSTRFGKMLVVWKSRHVGVRKREEEEVQAEVLDG